jgi:hypothetical protein
MQRCGRMLAMRDPANLHRCLSILCALTAAAAAAGDIVAFDEARDGDASDDRFTPTTITLTAGLNTVRGTFGQTEVPDIHDLDYITFTVPEGHRLDSFVVQAASVGGAFSFVGLQAGPIVTIPADWTSIETPLLGWAHFGTASVGRDLLPDMAVSPGSVGFEGPLAAGTYALWIMELDPSEYHSYSFGLTVTAVPAPPTLLVAALIVSLSRRRGR